MKYSLILYVFLLNIATSYSQEFRKYTNNFLYNGVDARGRALGNAVAASSEDVFAGYWNPAGLMDIDKERTHIGYMHVFDGLYNNDVLALAFPTNKNQTLGLTAVRYGVDDIPNTIFLIDASGNINPDNITTFNAADYGAFLSYSRNLSDRISIGGSAKIIHRNVGDFANAWGAGLDVGTKYTSEDKTFKGAIFARDLFGTYTSWDFQFEDPEIIAVFERTGNELPKDGSIEATSPSVVLGANYNLQLGAITLNPEANFDITFDGNRNTLISTNALSIDPHAGIEVGYENTVFLRAGINNVQEITREANFEKEWDMQPNLGGGVKLNGVEVDYALTQYDFREEMTHLVTLKFGIAKPSKPITPKR